MQPEKCSALLDALGAASLNKEDCCSEAHMHAVAAPPTAALLTDLSVSRTCHGQRLLRFRAGVGWVFGWVDAR